MYLQDTNTHAYNPKLKQIDKAFLAQRTKALRTQALTAFTSSFGLVGLVQYDW